MVIKVVDIPVISLVMNILVYYKEVEGGGGNRWRMECP